MIIYLEGPDGSGKSTLAQSIAAFCDATGIRRIYGEPLISTNPKDPKRVTKKYLLEAMTEMFENKKVCYILDRGPISDCIYRLFDDYEPVISFPELCEFLQKNDTNMLLVYCNNHRAEELMRKRGDDNQIALAKHHKISQAYDMAMFCLFKIVNCTKYNFTTNYGSYAIQAFLEQYFNL